MKNLAFCASLIATLAITPSIANAGFYIGAMVGGGTTELNLTGDDITDSKNEEGTFTAAVVGGFELPITKYAFLAGEVYIDATNTEFSENTAISRTEIRNNVQFGLNALIGANIQPWLQLAGEGTHNVGIYFLAGPHWEYWEDEVSVSSFTFGGTSFQGFSVSDERVYTGFQVGFGGRYIFPNSLGIRGEYRFARVERTSNNVKRETPSHEFGLGITYHF